MKIDRNKVNFETEVYPSTPTLKLNDDSTSLILDDKIINLKSITSIKLSIVNRIYNPGIGLMKDGFKGFMTHRNSGTFSIYFNYYFDLDINTTDTTYKLESTDLEHASSLILSLADKFNIDDPIDLINLFKNNDYKKAFDYINTEYKNLAIKYNLENPRTSPDPIYEQLINDKLNK